MTEYTPAGRPQAFTVPTLGVGQAANLQTILETFADDALNAHGDAVTGNYVITGFVDATSFKKGGTALQSAAETLANKSISGATNTLSAVPVSALNPVVIRAVTSTSDTLAAADASKRVTFSNASAGAASVPGAVFAAGDAVSVLNKGAGTWTFAGSAGLTLKGADLTLLTDESAVILFDDSTHAWFSKGGGIPKAGYSATTGSPTVDSATRSPKTVIKWTANGSITVTRAGIVEAMLIGGGGGGYLGGGGGGQVLYTAALWLPVGTHNINVGTAGALNGGSGGPSSIGSFITAAGGGAGGGTNAGQAGGNGGGGTGGSSAGTGIGAVSVAGGFAGGNAGSTSDHGGGGGAGAVGTNGNASGTGGNGGNGVANSITGASVTYGAGGGGGGATAGGTGGTGGGGAGSTTSGTAGSANTGSGGGGGQSIGGAAGGSGFVVIVVG